MKPLISIITVVRDDPVALAETLKSVYSQTYPNFEHIIIDGGSDHETPEILKSAEYCSAQWVREPDNGIYDAMNKGATLANGDWIIFMNAGDTFYAVDVLQRIFKNNIQEKIVFGKSLSVYGNQSALRYADFGLDDDAWYLKRMPNHQAVFIHKDIYRNLTYDSTYKYAADTDYLRRAFSCGDYKFADVIVSHFRLGGRSNYYGDYKTFKGVLNDILKLDGFSLPVYLAYWVNFLLQLILPKKLYMLLYVKYIVKK